MNAILQRIWIALALLPCLAVVQDGAAAPDLSDAAEAVEAADSPPAPNSGAAAETSQASFDDAASDISQRLKASVARLNELAELDRQTIAPLSARLAELEASLLAERKEYQEAVRTRDNESQAMANLVKDQKYAIELKDYVDSLMGEYMRNLESGLHIAENQRYRGVFEALRKAKESPDLSAKDVVAEQAKMLMRSIDRLEESIGGASFDGEAVDAGGIVRNGRFVLVGPAALFRSGDGQSVGTVELRVNSTEPAVIAYSEPEDAKAASALVANLGGRFPLDPTLGNAHKIESTRETLWEHINKGGPVMVPILAMAGAALIVVLYKWIALTLVPKPSQKKVTELLKAVSRHDQEEARRRVSQIRGPTGRMLSAGVDHMREPRELIEEVMYEVVMSTKLRLQRMLPFVAIAAASAPLLGLLGTVTGIINTFKLITVFGSGDVKMLSGGISEALITTEFGLIVAIPSLLLHAFLSRKARAMGNQMEKTAVAFANQVGKARFEREAVPA